MGKIGLLLVGVLLLITLNCVHADGGKKCRALVLEGGGDMGAYQVGVLKAFVDNLKNEDIQYDVITGVSVGSINAMSIALHEIGKEKEAIDWMYNLWSQLDSSAIYSNWIPGGMLQGLFYEEGIWNNMAEFDYMKKVLASFTEKKLYRKLDIVTVDLDSGNNYKFNETLDFDDLPNAIRASTSMPFAFPHTHFLNHSFVDGGTIWNIDLGGAIERCKEIVSDEKDIIVDTILCNSAQNITRDEQKKYNTIQNWERYRQIGNFYGTLSDYYEIMRGYPDVDFRYFLMPLEDLPSGFLPLGFVHDQIMAMIDIGIKEGEAAIKDNQESAREKVKRLSRKHWLNYSNKEQTKESLTFH